MGEAFREGFNVKPRQLAVSLHSSDSTSIFLPLSGMLRNTHIVLEQQGPLRSVEDRSRLLRLDHVVIGSLLLGRSGSHCLAQDGGHCSFAYVCVRWVRKAGDRRTVQRDRWANQSDWEDYERRGQVTMVTRSDKLLFGIDQKKFGKEFRQLVVVVGLSACRWLRLLPCVGVWACGCWSASPSRRGGGRSPKNAVLALSGHPGPGEEILDGLGFDLRACRLPFAGCGPGGGGLGFFPL